MTQLIRRWLVALLLVLVSTPAAAVADDVLQRIPENALGFVVVHDLAAANAKIERLLEPLDAPFPSPLTLIRMMTGLNAGIDLSGDLAIALLPGDDPQTEIEPMVFLPVTDYAFFARSLNGDTSGTISRVTLLGEDILIARDGNYALLMNVEHQQTMEELIELAAEPVAALSPLGNWTLQQDAALVVMPTGLEAIANWTRTPPRRASRHVELFEPQTLVAELLEKLLAQENRLWLHTHVELTGIGLQIDQQANVQLTQQVVLKSSSPYANLAPLAMPPVARLGFNDQSFVLTGGGPIATSWGNRLSTWWRQQEQASAHEDGYEYVSAEMWQREEQAYRALLGDVRSLSLAMLPGKQGEPLAGNLVGVATVADVDKYFDALPEVAKTWNEITQLSTSDFKPEYEVVPLQVAGNQGYELVTDIAMTARDARVPAINWMLEAALGREGKLRIRFVQVDETTFVFGMATPEQLADYIKTLPTDARQPLAANAQYTRELLPNDAPWQLMFTPRDALVWTGRVLNEFWAPVSNVEVTVPELPITPPLGLAVRQNGPRWQCTFVIPYETWKLLDEYRSIVLNW